MYSEYRELDRVPVVMLSAKHHMFFRKIKKNLNKNIKMLSKMTKTKN